MKNTNNLSQFALSEPSMALKLEFERLTTEFKEATKYSSNPGDTINHPSYQKIINMGPRVLPLIFEDVKRDNGFWYEALRQLTGSDPVPKSQWGDIKAMNKTWLKWAKS